MDANGTVVSSPHTINITAPVNPLSISPPSATICSGTPVTLTASGGTGTWTASPADPTLTTPTNATITVSPTQTTEYTFSSAPTSSTSNLVYNPGFESGNTGFSTSYNYYTATNNQTSYGIGNSSYSYDNFFTSMCTPHTGSDMLIADGATTAGVQVWGQTVPVIPGAVYTFSYWGQTLSPSGGGPAAALTAQINGTSIGSTTFPTATCSWTQYTYTWTAVGTTAAISLIDNVLTTNGNDFGIDDISFSTNVTCPVTDSVKVIVNSGTTVTGFSYASPVCANGTNPVPIPVAGFTTGGTYSATPAGLTINSSTGVVTLSSSTPNTYTVTYSVAASGCNPSGSSTASLVINALPTAAIAGATTICSGTGTNITFTGTPNATVTYTINGGANQTVLLNGAGTATVATGNLTANATYALVSVTSGGAPACSQPQVGNAVVTVNALPTAAIAGATTICSGTGTNITFTGTPNATVTYTINGGANQTVLLNGTGTATVATGNLTANATYALVSVTSGGAPACSQPQTGNAVVTVNALPTVTIAGTATITSGTGTNITFTGTANATVTYTINGGANQTVLLNGAGTATVATGNLTANTTYALVSITSGGAPACSQAQSGTAVITVTASPTATISGTTTICSGTAATISFNGTPNATVTYTVNGGANQTIVLDGAGNASLSTGSLTSNATYTLVSASVTVPTPGSNTLTGSATVTVKALPTAGSTAISYTC